jgi:uncharacterized protein (DUF302 family)
MEKIIIESNKSIEEVIDDIKENANNFNFIVRAVFDMKEQFRIHGVDVDENFNYYSIMLCNPQKAYESIYNKSERGALLLLPKQVVIYKKGDKTILSYVLIEKEDVEKLYSQDIKFQKGLEQSGKNIIKLMKSVA